MQLRSENKIKNETKVKMKTEKEKYCNNWEY